MMDLQIFSDPAIYMFVSAQKVVITNYLFVKLFYHFGSNHNPLIAIYKMWNCGQLASFMAF